MGYSPVLPSLYYDETGVGRGVKSKLMFVYAGAYISGHGIGRLVSCQPPIMMGIYYEEDYYRHDVAITL